MNRLVEKGEYERGSGSSSFNESQAAISTFPSSNVWLSQKYFHDNPSTDILAAAQRNLNGRISYSQSYNLNNLAITTFYSYDELGRVEWLVHKWYTGYNMKIKYRYDLQGRLTGKDILESAGRNLYYFYEYDQLGRLVKVFTDIDSRGNSQVKEAEYQYFANGTVKRVQLGNAQGMDYRYNSRDWLRMINHQNYDAIYEGYPQDPGKDGTNGIPVDKFSLDLGYDVQSHIGITQNAARQYSGNISWMMWRTKDVNFGGYSLLGQTFSYDFNNRLLSSNFGYYSTAWQNTNSFDVNASYDQNGNIYNITRYNNSAIQMDNLVYNYFPGYNRLQYVSDTQSSSYSTSDIDNQETNNYRYDDNGNMLQDLGNGIGFILYNIQNLPVSVYRTSGGQYNYHYDVNGQRILSTGSNKYFVNDYSGRQEALVNRSDNSKIEHNIYGNDLIGQVNRVGTTLNRYYYLKDHLGSIRARVNSAGVLDGYDSFYPYGMQMNGLCSTSGLDVRYKFTGKERDTETNYDYFGARYYDARLGRWLQVDPLASKYPGWSSYNYTLCNPLRYIDPDGNEIKPVTKEDERKWAITRGKLEKSTEGLRLLKFYDKIRTPIPLTYQPLPLDANGQTSIKLGKNKSGKIVIVYIDRITLDDSKSTYDDVRTPAHELTHGEDALKNPEQFSENDEEAKKKW